MDNSLTDSTEFYQLAEWFNKNRTKVISVVATVVILGAIAGIFIWHKNYNESQAGMALSNLRSPLDAALGTPATADDYLKIAHDYAGTHAAGRAYLIAGGIQFDAGKFDQSRQTFEQYLHEYSDDALADQAMLGVAASLEGAGKVDDAVARYTDFVKNHPSDAATPQAKSALARLYIVQGHPDLAMRQYEDLAHTGNNDSWTMEASIQLGELLAKYPNLKKAPVAAAPMAPVMKLSSSNATIRTNLPMAPAIKK